MKQILLLFLITLSFNYGTAQVEGSFYGGLESNSQWLQSDEGINFLAPEDTFRANNYLLLNYRTGKLTAGIQYETYLPSALLGYAPIYDGQNGIANYYFNYRNKNLDVTGGFFYDQFGSGLIFRSWEDRQLGLNNAIKGLNIKWNPTENILLKFVYGSQRNGFAPSILQTWQVQWSNVLPGLLRALPRGQGLLDQGATSVEGRE